MRNVRITAAGRQIKSFLCNVDVCHWTPLGFLYVIIERLWQNFYILTQLLPKSDLLAAKETFRQIQVNFIQNRTRFSLAWWQFYKIWSIAHDSSKKHIQPAHWLSFSRFELNRIIKSSHQPRLIPSQDSQLPRNHLRRCHTVQLPSKWRGNCPSIRKGALSVDLNCTLQKKETPRNHQRTYLRNMRSYKMLHKGPW